MKITDFEALRRQLDEMQNDPELAKELEALEGLNAKAEELGYTREQAARLLYPARFHDQARQKHPIVNLKRRPKDVERQILLYEDLKAARAQIDLMMSRINSEAAFQHRHQLINAAEAFDFTPAQASQILHPATNSSVSKSASARKKNKGNGARRRMRYWKNPHNGHVVRGRNVNIRELNHWKKQYGQQVVNDWEIPADQASD